MNSAPPLEPRNFFALKMTKRHKLTARCLFIAGTALLLVVPVAGRGWTGDDAFDTPPRQVAPLTVDAQPLVPCAAYLEPRTYSGTVQPRRSSSLSFRRTDQLEAVLVDQAAHVAAGQALAQLATRTLSERSGGNAGSNRRCACSVG